MNWVSTKDRLPEKNILVFGLEEDGSLNTVWWEPQSSHYPNKTPYPYKGAFLHNDHCCPDERRITHWLSLEEIPLPSVDAKAMSDKKESE